MSHLVALPWLWELAPSSCPSQVLEIVLCMLHGAIASNAMLQQLAVLPYSSDYRETLYVIKSSCVSGPSSAKKTDIPFHASLRGVGSTSEASQSAFDMEGEPASSPANTKS